MDNDELKKLVSLLEERNQLLLEKERDLADRSEEFTSQKEELTAAIEEVVRKNAYLSEALDKLQQRNQELDQILYRASHDLKSPVSSIFGLLDLLRADRLTESQTTIHHHLFQKASQMMALLNSLNMLAQAAFDSIHSRPVPVRKTIFDTIQQLKSHPDFDETIFKLDASDSLTFLGDELKVSILLRCLLENAMVFRTPGQRNSVSILARMDERNVILEVEDNGPGVPAEVQGKIFEMFYRGSEQSRGAGLGLYIVKSIADRLKGSVAFTSSPGCTLFTVSLPVSNSNIGIPTP